MNTDVLQEIVEVVRADSHGGAALVLFSLVMTMSAAQGQYLFLLNKLRDLSPENRQLAYRLMECMAEGGNESEAWRNAVVEMENLIRHG